MNDAFAADTADTLPFTGLTPYGRPSWSGLLQFSLVGRWKMLSGRYGKFSFTPVIPRYRSTLS